MPPLPLRAAWGCPAGPVPPSMRRRRRHAPAFLPRPLCPFQRRGERPQNPPGAFPVPAAGSGAGAPQPRAPRVGGHWRAGSGPGGNEGRGREGRRRAWKGRGRLQLQAPSPLWGPGTGGGCVHPPLSPPNPRGTAPALHPPQGAPQSLLPGPEGGTPRPGGRPPPRSPLRSPGGAGGGAASIGRGAAASSARRSGAGRRRRRRREREGEGGRAPGCAASLEPSLAAAGAAAARG